MAKNKVPHGRKNPQIWRMALLDRAMALHLEPFQVVEEILPVMGYRPPSIDRSDAAKLAREYPYSPENIYRSFQIPAELPDGP